jgi:hypothetical protein
MTQKLVIMTTFYLFFLNYIFIIKNKNSKNLRKKNPRPAAQSI